MWHNVVCSVYTGDGVHSCDCVGTCVGESNRRLFVLYLLLQSLEGAVMIGVTTSAISEAEDIDDWFKINALYLVLCFMIVCVLLMVVPLLGYQAFLISTNQVRAVSASFSCVDCSHERARTRLHL